MKTIKYCMILFAAVLFCTSCDPIEDESLRDKYYRNVGNPISKADLQAAISITQPIANSDDKVEGDQYVALKNSRPDIGGVWHVGTSTGEKTFGSDDFTYIYESNGTFNIYYVGISANQTIQTDPVQVTVTNVFDIWDNLFTGAQDKADKTAKKTWKFREVDWGSVCNMGAHGGWRPSNGHTPESKNTWWASYTYAQVGDQKMVFEFDGKKMITYNADGSLKAEGAFAYSHDLPDRDAVGTMITTIPTIGGNLDDCGQKTGSNNTFWLLRLEENYITIYHPSNYTNPADWEDYGWYAYFEVDE